MNIILQPRIFNIDLYNVLLYVLKIKHYDII